MVVVFMVAFMVVVVLVVVLVAGVVFATRWHLSIRVKLASVVTSSTHCFAVCPGVNQQSSTW